MSNFHSAFLGCASLSKVLGSVFLPQCFSHFVHLEKVIHLNTELWQQYHSSFAGIMSKTKSQPKNFLNCCVFSGLLWFWFTFGGEGVGGRKGEWVFYFFVSFFLFLNLQFTSCKNRCLRTIRGKIQNVSFRLIHCSSCKHPVEYHILEKPLGFTAYGG